MFRVEIPKYINEIKLASKRMKKTWKQSKVTAEKPLPLKYQTDRYIWKNGKLWDTVEKDFVAKNSKTVGTPRYLGISGNTIMRQMEEHVRMKIVNQVKASFKPYLRDLPRPLPTPLMMHIELYAPLGYGNWDLDNLWIYHKCMQDLLQDEGYLPDDTVQFITGASGILYTPVKSEEERKMVFIFQKDNRPEILEHNQYSQKECRPWFIRERKNLHVIAEMQKVEIYEVIESNKIKAGELNINAIDKYFNVGTGKKKVLYPAARKAIDHIYSQCMQWNCKVAASQELYEKYQKFFDDLIVKRFIQLYVYGSGNEVHGSTQDVRHQIRSEASTGE